MTSAGDRWEVLERIGAYVAGELSDEEAQRTKRLLLEDAAAWHLADPYAQMLAHLRVVGEERPEPPQTLVAIAECTVRRAAREAATEGGTKKGRTRCG